MLHVVSHWVSFVPGGPFFSLSSLKSEKQMMLNTQHKNDEHTFTKLEFKYNVDVDSCGSFSDQYLAQ